MPFYVHSVQTFYVSMDRVFISVRLIDRGEIVQKKKRQEKEKQRFISSL